MSVNLGGHPSRTVGMTPIAPQARKKTGGGCLGSVGGAIVAVLVVSLLLNPWALHMGGRWTPALTWHGVGNLHSSTGAAYGLYMEVMLRGGTGVRSRNLQGTAKLCTLQGQVYPLTVSGYLRRAWLDADGKPVTFSFYSPKDAQPVLRFDLLGSWKGQELVLDDKGTMAMSFSVDGKAKGYLRGQNAPKETTSGGLRYATENELAAVCGDKTKSSF